MCNVQGKLAAWLDGELPANEAAEVAQHLELCEECRGRAAAYKQVTGTFTAYCDAVMQSKTQPRVPRWVPVLAAAIVFAGVLLLVFPRMRIPPPPVLTPTIAATYVPAALPAVAAPDAAPRKAVHKRHVAARTVQKQAAQWQPTESAVQIAIPADAMFAPGAAPKGMNFIAELSIAPDGSVKQVRLRQ